MVGARITLERLDLDAEMVEKKRGVPKEVSKVVLETVIEDRQNHKRQPKPEPPEGGISLRAAERKHHIPCGTLCRWVQRGLIPVLLRTPNWLYVDEAKLVEVIQRYKQNPGQGKKTIKTQKVHHESI
jgi:hypothetical protein